MTFDELRTRHPLLSIAVYAYEPFGPVTLEILSVDGRSMTVVAPTLTEAIAKAFPTPAERIDEPTDDIFT